MVAVLRILAVCVMVGGLAACAGQPAIPFDRAAAPEIKKVGIIAPAMPDQATAYLAASPGQSFGLIGALIDAGIQAKREERLAAVLNSQKFVAASTFTENLAEAVRAHGYEVEVITATRPEPKKFLANYPTDAKVDAFLDVVSYTYGYMAAGVSSSLPYRPMMYVQCKLVRARDAQVLMQDTVVYNPLGRPGKEVTIAPDPNFAFETIETIESSPERTTEGLRLAFRQTADAVGTLVK